MGMLIPGADAPGYRHIAPIGAGIKFKRSGRPKTQKLIKLTKLTNSNMQIYEIKTPNPNKIL